VNQSQKPFRINVGFLINQSIGFSREIPFSFGQYQFQDEENVENLVGTITLVRTQAGIQALVGFTALVNTQCVRCLEDFKQSLHTSFQELYTYAVEPLSEDEESIPEDGFLDFENSISDYLFLEYPMNPLCKPDCRGLCVVCGQNLNDCACEHVKKK